MKVTSILLFASVFLLMTRVVLAEDKFRVCADPLNPPYSSKDGSGFENKIADLFAKQLNQKLEYKWFPQRIGFIRNTLKAKLPDSDLYSCDVVMGVPAGYELALTTKPYYHSTYLLLIAKGRGWDDISKPRQLEDLPLSRQGSLKIAMLDRGPGTALIQAMGLLEQGVPYQTMTGDDQSNLPMQIEKDLKGGKIDMAILWGPMAGYVLSQSPKDTYKVIKMVSRPGIKFDFSIAMAVRYGDKERLSTLNRLIDENRQAIREIMMSYQVPLLPIPEQQIRKDDD
jgi:quinoprotein dehydrogenase-associated probable ABC transporter substrate-binding protein